MAATDAQKRATIKWQKENLTTVGVKMRKDIAEDFKLATGNNGTTRNQVLLQFVKDYIKQNLGKDYDD